MKFMYSISYQKPNDTTNYTSWYGGNTEDEAKAACLKSSVDFHNKYNANKLTAADLKIVECKLSGDYQSVLRELERG